MQEDSSHPDLLSKDSQVVNHYPTSNSNSFTEVLYKNRKQNSDLFGKIISQTKQNLITQKEIEDLKTQLPLFLLNSWKSSQGPKTYALFLQELSSNLQLKMNCMNKSLREHKADSELNQAEYEEELLEREKLRKNLQEMEGKREDLSKKNQLTQNDINFYKNEILKLINRYSSLQKSLAIINEAKILKTDKINQFEASFRDQPFQANKQQKFLEKQETYAKNLAKRKEYFRAKIDYLLQCQQSMKNTIEMYLKEKREKEHLKESIMAKRRDIEEVTKKVEEARRRKNMTKKKKEDQEKVICQQAMEKSIKYCDQLNHRYKKLAEKTIEKLRQTIEKPNISKIQMILNNE